MGRLSTTKCTYLPTYLSGCGIRRRTSLAGGVAGPHPALLCYGVLRCPRGQVISPLG